jgi:hypothetical protein
MIRMTDQVFESMAWTNLLLSDEKDTKIRRRKNLCFRPRTDGEAYTELHCQTEIVVEREEMHRTEMMTSCY